MTPEAHAHRCHAGQTDDGEQVRGTLRTHSFRVGATSGPMARGHRRHRLLDPIMTHCLISPLRAGCARGDNRDQPRVTW
jgi:hypothetical protein